MKHRRGVHRGQEVSAAEKSRTTPSGAPRAWSVATVGLAWPRSMRLISPSVDARGAGQLALRHPGRQAPGKQAGAHIEATASVFESGVRLRRAASLEILDKRLEAGARGVLVLLMFVLIVGGSSLVLT